MSSLEALQRRNRDQLLIETIKRVGVSNYSLVARLTGINAETVRYKINKQLDRFGLSVLVNVNYGELGFVSGFLSVKATPLTVRSWIDRTSYLTFIGKIIGSDRFACLYAIPLRFKSKYIETLSDLKQQGLIDEFESIEIYWIRYPPFRSEFYNFDDQTWKVDWKRVNLTSNEAGVNMMSINRDPIVDYVDLAILRCLQEDPTISPAKIAKLSNMNARTVRYHHLEHVQKGNMILGNNMRWTKPIQEGNPNKLMQMIYSFKKLTQPDFEAAKRLFNKIPFTWLETATEDKSYFAFLDVPIENFHETVGFIESHLDGIKTEPEMSMLDPSKTQYPYVPDVMFDKKRGWRLPNYQGDTSGIR